MPTPSNSNVDLDNLNVEMQHWLAELEEVLNRELVITSGYRSPEHPIEKKKKRPGEHSKGMAIDVFCKSPQEFIEVIAAATSLGCRRIGISRKKGSKSGFIHLGMGSVAEGFYPALWVYPT